jgi:ribosome maturation factor RimP
MRNTLAQKVEREIAPLLEVHGVDLVALEWFQGAGRGLLRLTVDRPGGDPRVQDPSRGVAVDVLTHITRDVSTTLDELETKNELVIDVPYQLEVTSPGPERPLQKRADFDRFAGLRVRLDMGPRYDGPSTLRGAIEGTKDADEGFIVRLRAGGKLVEVPMTSVARARLEEIPPPKSTKPGKPGASASSKRQERLKARAKARAINEEHLRRKNSSEEATGASSHASPVEGGVEHADDENASSGAQR